jgi:hydroxyethylthiazole kinase
MSNVIVAAFAAVQPDPFIAAVGGLVAFGAAGELAAQVSGNQPGTFAVELLNGLYALDPATIEALAKVTTAQV